LKIAILGVGVVGGGTAEVLVKNKERIARSAGEEIEIKHILCRRPRPSHPFARVLTQDFEEILKDESVGIVAECMGGLEPAYSYVKSALAAGKSVVTSNKELVSERGRELCALAREKGVHFKFEAAVGGGIPVIRPINKCLAANEISQVSGILNGTTNYILTEMINFGKSFEAALKEAQEKGYAESDPTADVEGIDAARKISILADLCFNKEVLPKYVRTEGISKISPEDIDYARAAGYRVKLIARAMRTGANSVTAFVEPQLVAKTHPLASINGVQNAVLIRGDAVGEVLLAGPGAGAYPTASAVVADIIDAVAGPNPKIFLGWWPSEPGYAADADELSSKFLIRVGPRLKEIGENFSNIRFINKSGARADEYAFITGYTTKKEIMEKAEAIELRAIYRLFE
jgi:homoserine dehydrogenase